MIALVLFLVAIGVLNGVTYLRSADAAIRIWRWRGGIRCYRAFAHAEFRGWRIRTPDLALAQMHGRLQASVAVVVGILFVGSVLWVGSAFSWPAQIPVAVVTGWLMLQTSQVKAVVAATGNRLAVGGTAALTAALCAGGVTTLFFAIRGSDREAPPASWLGLLVAAYVMLVLSRLAARRTHQLASRSRVLTPDAEVTRDDNLYLRSFGDDGLRLRSLDPFAGVLGQLTGGAVRFEELIAAGPAHTRTVAIGRPGEPLPELGAHRVYVRDDAWQDLVARTASRVGTIFLVAGSSAGLGWEVEHLRSNELLRKTIVLLPPLAESHSWHRFHTVLRQLELGFESTESEDGAWLNVFIPTLIGIGVSATGRPVFYVSERRDWLSYLGAITLHRAIALGSSEPPLHGTIGRVLFPELQLEEQ